MTHEADEALVYAIDRFVEILKEENLKENDMLLEKLAQSRAKAERVRGLIPEEDFIQIMNELDEASAAIQKIRSEI